MARGSDPPRDRQRGDVLTGGFPDPGIPRRNGWRAGPDRDRRRRSGGAARAAGPGLRAIRSMAATRVRGSARERARAVHLPRHRARTRGRCDAHRCPPRGYHPAHPAAPEGKVSATDRIVSLLICDDHKLLTDALATAKAAADGEVLIDPATLTRLLAQVARQREEQRDALVLLDDLTDREREILGLLAQGKRNDDIARELYISPQTVQTHVRNILGKLRVHSKLEAVSFAVKHGAIQVG